MSLEESILRHALGERAAVASELGAAGVMMIPILRRGIYRGVEGLDEARAVRGIEGVSMTAEPGQIVAPPPEGASYLGFIFSRASDLAEAEAALRSAHRLLRFEIMPECPAALAAAGVSA